MTPSEDHLAIVRGGAPRSAALLGEREWAQLVGEFDAHRTTGYLSWAVAEGRVRASDEQREELFNRHGQLMHRALVVDAAAREVVSAPTSGPMILFKGVAAAHLDHDDPSMRSYQDVDVLVPSHAIEATVRNLERGRATRDLPPRWPDWDRRFAKDITFVVASGVEIDLHRTLVPGPFGFALDLDDVASDLVTFELGGVAVQAFGPERRAIASALALTVGEPTPRLAAAVDMVGALQRHATDVDAVIRLSERWRVGALVAEGCNWTEERLGPGALPTDLQRWATTRSVAAWEQRWRRLYRSRGGTNTATLLGAPLGMDRRRDQVDYLRGLLRPSPEYRAARARSARPREWRTGARELVRSRAPWR